MAASSLKLSSSAYKAPSISLLASAYQWHLASRLFKVMAWSPFNAEDGRKCFAITQLLPAGKF